jgi:phosphatidylserine decarboxylase precursor-related protein
MNVITFLLAILIAFLIFFIRSPDRSYYKYDPKFLYSPCNGQILHIKEIDDKTIRIVYYLNVFDNHTQYIPIDSEVVSTKRYLGTGVYYKAYDRDSDKNSNMETVFRSINNNFTYKVTQRTGIIARRIINYLENVENKETKCSAGDKLGFIMFGSRVDIDVPKNVIGKILVMENEHINGIKKIIELK